MAPGQIPPQSGLTVDAAARQLAAIVPPGEGWGQHSEVVAEVTGHICGALEGAGVSVDREFAVSAALLHDVGRSQTHHPTLHGWEGYRILSGQGVRRHALVCITHVLKGRPIAAAVEQGICPVMALDEDFVGSVSPLEVEHAIVAVADAMVVDTSVVDIAARYRRSRARYPGDAFIAENEALSQALRSDLESMLGRSVYDVLPAELGSPVPGGASR